MGLFKFAGWRTDTLAELGRACPGLSRDLIRRILRQRQKAGEPECLNRGPGAVWRKKVNSPKSVWE